jgi:hypothetical protein
VNVITLIFILSLWVALAIVILHIRDRIEYASKRRKYTPERIAEMELKRTQHILESDWTFYERYLQRPVPLALRELFADRHLISQGHLEYQDTVLLTLTPIKESELIESQEWFGVDIVQIATSESGDPIYLRPGVLEPDAVYITYHDGMNTEELAQNVEVFVQRLRNNNHPPKAS